ncbi:MAG TPA: terminase gpA endonuclease subunit [Thermoguttaceae bacterium]
MIEFCEKEFVIPKGKYKGTLINWDVQPFSKLYFQELDKGIWPRSVVTGAVQSGKSTISFVIPVLYYIFECEETTIAGGPTMIVNRDKFNKELLPAILASRYRDQLPSDGSGSRGGWVEEITFNNSAAIKFMASKGGDERRSSYTARCVVLTEIDKFDQAGGASRETDPVTQMEDRSLSFLESERRFHGECTVSIRTGRIWTEFEKSTASIIVCQCPHCEDWVTPEREHLAGWQDAESEIDARRRAYFACPACGSRLTEKQRVEMNRAAKLLHRGQKIDQYGLITGDPPATNTFGFRWNAFNNLFWTPGEIAAKEWKTHHSTAMAEQAAEKELCQYYWAIPYESPDFDSTPLDVHQVRRRFSERKYTRGLIPEDSNRLSMAIDCGQRFCTWKIIAWRPGCRGHIADYGTFEVHSRDQAVDKALLSALRNFRDDVISQGWHTPAGEIRMPDVVFIDGGWKSEIIYEFIRESGPRFRPAIGYGLSQGFRRYRSYHKPSKTGTEVKLIGDEYHVVWVPKERLFRIDLNVDYWKTKLFDALHTPLMDEQGNPVDGSIEFYHSNDPNEHMTVAKHYTAERSMEVFTPGTGTEMRWIIEHRANHFLDVAAYALCAAHLVGVRLTRETPDEPAKSPSPAEKERRSFLTPDGRPFLLTDRESNH